MNVKGKEFEVYLDRLSCMFMGFTFTQEQARQIVSLVMDLVYQGIKPTDMKARGLGLSQLEYFDRLLRYKLEKE